MAPSSQVWEPPGNPGRFTRAARVADIVTRSISGHATETMQRHYSTVNPEEVRSGLAEIISITGLKKAMEAA